MIKFLFPKMLGFVAPAPASAPKMLQDSVSLVLNKAADIIKKRGLVQGTFSIQANGSMCTYTAIKEAAKQMGLTYTFAAYLAETRMIKQVGEENIAHWTDNLIFFPKQRVIWNLRRAAKRA